MSETVRHLVGLLFFCCASAALAQPAPGDYVINEGAVGMLSIRRDSRFSIETVGGNASTCELDGKIVSGQAKIGDSACVLRLQAEGHDVRVSAASADECRDFCGMRASFEGLYRKPPPACRRTTMESTRNTFKRQYDARKYRSALATLTPVFTTCSNFMNWLEKASVANDLALTQFRLGDNTGCLTTLSLLAGDAAKSDSQLRESLPPADFQDYLPAVRAARTNLRLCHGAPKRG